MAEETVKSESSEVVHVPADTKPAVTESEAPVSGDSGTFKEETNVVGELPNPHQLALDQLKKLVREALDKHEFSALKVSEEEKTPQSDVAAVVASEVKPEAKAEVESSPPVKCEPEVSSADQSSDKGKDPPEGGVYVASAEEPESVVASPAQAPPLDTVAAVVAPEEPAAVKAPPVDTIAAVAARPEEPVVEAPPCVEPAVEAVAEPQSSSPQEAEQISIWGIQLFADERTDVVLLKFLRARDFKVKEAFVMLKSVVAWRKEFGIDELIVEDLGSELEKVVFMHGVDKEGHPVCYNVFGEFSNKELYHNTFPDEEKRTKFLRWRIQLLEKSIRKLDFSPYGISTIVQVNDLKNSPGFFARELRQATNQALQLLQDNYPEFVAKQVVINVPWWYLTFYRMISPFFTQRTKSKLLFVGPSKSAETLFKYIAPEQVPVQFGGLSKEGEQEFSTDEPAAEDIIKPTCIHTIELPITETCLLVWEARVIGWDVSYAAEFVPVEGYTIIVQKSRKMGPSDEPVICGSYKSSEPGKLILTFNNQTTKKKKLLYRSKTKPSE